MVLGRGRDVPNQRADRADWRPAADLAAAAPARIDPPGTEAAEGPAPRSRHPGRILAALALVLVVSALVLVDRARCPVAGRCWTPKALLLSCRCACRA